MKWNAKVIFLCYVSKTWSRGTRLSTWVVFGRPCVCTVCSYKKCTRTHDHEFWAFVVDVDTAVFMLYVERKNDSGRARPRKAQVVGRGENLLPHSPLGCDPSLGFVKGDMKGAHRRLTVGKRPAGHSWHIFNVKS